MMSTQISRFLNKEHWISASELEIATGLTERKIRDLVRAERLAGVPIVSGDKGYKIAKSYSEIEDLIARIKSHALSELEIVSAINRGYGIEQLTLKI